MEGVVKTEEESKTNGSSGLMEESKQTAEDKKSVLSGSIQQYGTNSYYYAHGPKEFDVGEGKRCEGSGIIHGGEPLKVEPKHPASTTAGAKKGNKKITKYSWIDEKKKVKIYIDLNQDLFKDKVVTESTLDFKIEETFLNLIVVDEESICYEFQIKKLYDKIEPEKCKAQVTKDKIKITLHKWIETKWKDLSAKK